ncbi:MAG TPA: hypothetical protein VIU11_03740 [Nakamurella sp.]
MVGDPTELIDAVLDGATESPLPAVLAGLAALRGLPPQNERLRQLCDLFPSRTDFRILLLESRLREYSALTPDVLGNLDELARSPMPPAAAESVGLAASQISFLSRIAPDVGEIRSTIATQSARIGRIMCELHPGGTFTVLTRLLTPPSSGGNDVDGD